MSNALIKFVSKDVSVDDKKKLDLMKERMGIERVPMAHVVSLKGEILIAFDATGSMHGPWHEASQSIHKLCGRLSQIIADPVITLLAYRDYCDFNRLLEVLPRERNPDAIKRFIDGIHCDGGGDEPEAVEQALKYGLDNEAGMIIIVGDAPPHGVIDSVHGDVNYREVCKKLAEKEIPVYTVATHGYNHLVQSFTEIAELTKGKFFMLERIDDLIDVLSAAVARPTGTMSLLRSLIQREQGGMLTAKQNELLSE